MNDWDDAERRVERAQELFEQRRWSEAQLQQLQTRLQQFHFLGDLQRPLEAERAAAAALVRGRPHLDLRNQAVSPVYLYAVLAEPPAGALPSDT